MSRTVFGALIGALLLPCAPALGDDPADALRAKIDAESTKYLHDHPLKPSSVLDNSLKFARLLGTAEEMANTSCGSNRPDFPDLALESLHQNTGVAMMVSFTEGMRAYIAEFPAEKRVLMENASNCIEESGHVYSTLKELRGLVSMLKRHGY